MLSKTYRLREDKAITKALRVGRRINHPAISLVVSKSNDTKTKVAVVVGTKTDKRAVVRNKLKRRTREALRPLLPRLLGGFDIVAFPRLEVGEMDFVELKKIIEDLFVKARLLV